MEIATTLMVEVAMGIGLAACAGLRAFLPLFVAGLAGRFQWITLSSSFEWLGETPSLIVLGVAVVTEILSDKIPVVDHLLDLIGGVVKPVAGTVLAASVLSDLTPLQSAMAGIVLGGGSAGLVHVAKAKVRLFSSVTTAGLGNPLLSVGEDVASLVGSAVAIVFPFLLILVVMGTIATLLALRRRLRLRVERLDRRGAS